MSTMRKRTEAAKSSAQPGQLWPHLRYVTPSDVFSAIAASLGLFAIVGMCAAGFYWAAEKIPAGQGAEGNEIPPWVRYAAIAAIALWALRGHTLRIPRWTFGSWLCVSLFAAAVSYVATNCGGLIQVLLLLGAALIIPMLDALNDRGMTNAEAAAGDESAIGAP
jgi:hypothetical protein